MLGYNRTITRTNINVLINIGPGAGGGRKRRGKKGNLPNTFDDDCSLDTLMPVNDKLFDSIPTIGTMPQTSCGGLITPIYNIGRE